MVNRTLYFRELRGSWKLLVIFAGVLTMYITMIIWMYDPKMAEAMEQFEQLMPELMAAVGMTRTEDSLISFMSSYLYGMILLVFPMVYTIIRAHGLVARYVDRGSMAALLAAPVKRTSICLTQLSVLVTGVLLLMGYATVLELAAAGALFPGELDVAALLRLNSGLLALQLFLAGFCFFCSCLFDDARYSLAAGAGVPVLMYLMQMLANMGGKLENFRYLTIFSLFQTHSLIQGEGAGWLGTGVLLVGAVLLAGAAVVVFFRRDLPV